MSEKAKLEETTRALAQYLNAAHERQFKRLKNIVIAEIVLVGGIIYFGTITSGMGYVAIVLGVFALALVGLIFKEGPAAYESKEYQNWRSAAEEYFKAAGVDMATLSPGIENNNILYHPFENGTFYGGEIYDGHGKVNDDYTEIELRLTNTGEYFLMSAGKEIKP